MSRWMRRGMLAGWLLAAVLGSEWARAQSATTTVQATLADASGTAETGTVVVSWGAFTTATGVAVAAGSLSTTLGAGGALSVALTPNAGATPMGSYYTAVYHLSDGTTSREFWVVPATTSGTVTLAAIRNQVLPTSLAMQTVSKGYVDTIVAKAMAGVAPSGNVPYLLKAGDTLEGPLTLPGDPVQALQAADKHYVDTAVAGVTLNGGAGGDLGGAFPNPTVSAVHATSGTLVGVTASDPSILTPSAAANRRSALSGADWQARLRWFKQQRPSYPVTLLGQIPFGSAYPNLGITAASDITLGTSPSIRTEGCPASQVVTSTSYPVGYQYCATAQGYHRMWRHSTIVSSDVISTPMLSQGQFYRWWIDGVPTGYFQQTAPNGNFLLSQVTFKDGRQHRVTFETDGSWYGFTTPNGSADLAAPDWPLGPRIAWFGDSLSEPTITGTFTGNVGYPMVAAELLKWNNWTNYAEGGTGYSNDDSGLRTTWPGHVVTDGCSYPLAGGEGGFDAYVFAGSVNDAGASPTALQTAAYNTYAAAHTCSPNATILVAGPIYANNLNGNSGIAAMEGALQAAVAQAVAAGINAIYIGSPGAEEWQSLGGAPAECPYLSNGAVSCAATGDASPHPTQMWHEFYGVSMAQRIAAAAPFLTNFTDTSSPLPEVANSRVLHRSPLVSGQWTFSSSSATVTGTGGNAIAELSAGDQITYNPTIPSSTFTVASVTDANHFVLTVTPPSYWTNGGNATPVQLVQGWIVQRADLPNGTTQLGSRASAMSFHEMLATPSNSSASCSAGDFTDDANYHYVCVADSVWKRVALNTF